MAQCSEFQAAVTNLALTRPGALTKPKVEFISPRADQFSITVEVDIEPFRERLYVRRETAPNAYESIAAEIVFTEEYPSEQRCRMFPGTRGTPERSTIEFEVRNWSTGEISCKFNTPTTVRLVNKFIEENL